MEYTRKQWFHHSNRNCVLVNNIKIVRIQLVSLPIPTDRILKFKIVSAFTTSRNHPRQLPQFQSINVVIEGLLIEPILCSNQSFLKKTVWEHQLHGGVQCSMFRQSIRNLASEFTSQTSSQPAVFTKHPKNCCATAYAKYWRVFWKTKAPMLCYQIIWMAHTFLLYTNWEQVRTIFSPCEIHEIVLRKKKRMELCSPEQHPKSSCDIIKWPKLLTSPYMLLFHQRPLNNKYSNPMPPSQLSLVLI